MPKSMMVRVLNQIIEKKNEISSQSGSTSNKSKKHIEKGPF